MLHPFTYVAFTVERRGFGVLFFKFVSSECFRKRFVIPHSSSFDQSSAGVTAGSVKLVIDLYTCLGARDALDPAGYSSAAQHSCV